MKKWICALCLILALPLTVRAEESALPDPGASFFAAGELLASDAEVDGVLYDVYGYTYEKDASTSLSSTLTVYQWKVQAAGFVWEKLEDKSANDGIRGDEWYAIANDDFTAQLCVSGSYFATACTAALYVPEGMPFLLEENVAARSQFQNDLFVDSNDLALSGDGEITRVTCLSCHGTGICGICDGDGTYRNPYTGNLLACSSCDDGVCSVCDGTGCWGD